ncbi:MAG: ribose-5-phosphate isomerase RpiA [Candidatus Altiarchaeota archaeon]
MNNIELAKKLSAKKAIEFVKEGMSIGLGTGTTTEYFIYGLSKLIAKEKIKIVGIPTSLNTEKLAKKLKIPISTLDKYPEVDLCIDGADQIDFKFNMIKGGKGAHTREKIIAKASKKYVVIVDYTKISRILNREVPVEILNFSKGFVEKELIKIGGTPKLRENFITDNGCIILDTKFKRIDNAKKTELMINSIPGVIENGIFSMRKPDIVIVGYPEKVEILERRYLKRNSK